MPKIAMDYSRTQMYKIVCKDTTIIYNYVGHTTQWTKRKYQHKHNCINENSKKYNFKVYTFIRANGGWDNWDMILIEEYPCENKLQAERRERYWIETLNATLNQVIPTRNDKEYYEDNKKEHLEKCKKYYEENKDQILEYHKQYYEQNKDQILEYQTKHKEQNRDQILDYQTEYREQNREYINEKRREKNTCECGSIICYGAVARHQRTKKHQDYMEQKEG